MPEHIRRKPEKKIDDIQWQGVWQCQKARHCVRRSFFPKSDSDYEGEQVAGTEGALQNHQCKDEQGLEYIVPCTES